SPWGSSSRTTGSRTPSGSGRGSGSGTDPRRTRIRRTARTRATLDEGRLELRPIAAHWGEELVLLQDLLDLEERDRGLDLLRAAAPAVALHPGMDEAEHVELRDEVRDPALREDGHPRLPAQFLVRAIDVPGRHPVRSCLPVRDDREEDELRLRREGLDRLGDGVELDLVLRPLDVLVRDVLLRRALRELRGDPEEVQG